MKILIVGDSFSSDWSVKHKDVPGWPLLLSNIYNVTNCSQAGVGEYKIYKQLISVDLDNYDIIIITHTSPYRITTKKHPVHCHDSFHKNADLLFSDIEYHSKKIKSIFNQSLRAAYNFFIWHADDEYQESIYQLLVNEIDRMLTNKHIIVMVTPLAAPSLSRYQNQIVIPETEVNPGMPNHLSCEYNQIVFDQIVTKINEIKSLK
jgi:hypothetical protein